ALARSPDARGAPRVPRGRQAQRVGPARVAMAERGRERSLVRRGITNVIPAASRLRSLAAQTVRASGRLVGKEVAPRYPTTAPTMSEIRTVHGRLHPPRR